MSQISSFFIDATKVRIFHCGSRINLKKYPFLCFSFLIWFTYSDAVVDFVEAAAARQSSNKLGSALADAALQCCSYLEAIPIPHNCYYIYIYKYRVNFLPSYHLFWNCNTATSATVSRTVFHLKIWRFREKFLYLQS